ncbi:hypothetical protein [Tanticharoenia sakaeratensis]|uniref:Lipoprotein n=1 Tax=Tanticharoenia sakaeratensis NBRC 103193 TaxID=1231623 RepID=A0A0D6MK60_9PROT|nr:hypothetical protein [Tanticharoenia sakaeratensis]GAN54059.1 hypothetical protein Tasa_015_048 [Tanticharoenia sakaeratensis NBRC 103193]GBQ23722.1 hypothetical protein AA103193_2512 [Tanticharoenia sakaeratensis NBRC 103193]
MRRDRPARRNASPKGLLPALTLAICLSACAPPDFRVPGAISPSATYDALFPDYIELCAVSQIAKKPGFGADIAGGPGGHAVLFLQGACLDRSSGYPVLRHCSGRGTGVSMNAHFTNANWVGVSDRDFFFDGILSHDGALTRTDYLATKAEARRRGLYSAIGFHDWAVADRPAGVPRDDWKYEVSIGTDYAVAFGRARYCARLPVTSAQMTRTIDFLNARNAVYRSGQRVFDSNVLQDNCSHLNHNAIAATGFWKPWPINQFIVSAALSFPVPKNELVNLLDREQSHDPGDLDGLYHDRLTRETLLADGWLPQEPGVLVDSAPVHTPNDVYRTKLSLIFYDDPVFGHYPRAFTRDLNDARNHDLATNLRWYQATYAAIARCRRPLHWWLKREPADFSRFYSAYYAWLEREQAVVARGLTALNGADATASGQTRP